MTQVYIKFIQKDTTVNLFKKCPISILCLTFLCVDYDREYLDSIYSQPLDVYEVQSLFQKQPPRRFSKYLFFFSRSNLFTIFQEGLSVLQTDTNFPGGFIEQTRRFICSSKRPYFSSNIWTNFPKNSYLVPEHMPIFQELLFFHRTDIHFPGSPI